MSRPDLFAFRPPTPADVARHVGAALDPDFFGVLEAGPNLRLHYEAEQNLYRSGETELITSLWRFEHVLLCAAMAAPAGWAVAETAPGRPAGAGLQYPGATIPANSPLFVTQVGDAAYCLPCGHAGRAGQWPVRSTSDRPVICGGGAECLSRRSSRLRQAAIAILSGCELTIREPLEPTRPERLYLDAAAAYEGGNFCRGDDCIVAGDEAAGIDSVEFLAWRGYATPANRRLFDAWTAHASHAAPVAGCHLCQKGAA